MVRQIGHCSGVLAFTALLLTVAGTARTQEAHDHGHSQQPAATDNRSAPSAMGAGMAAGGGDMCMGMMGKDRMPMMDMMREMHTKMMGGAMMPPKGDTGPSSLAFNGIATRMHKDMDVTYTGKTDVDFAKSMIPHHQAAVDMAKTELAFGNDPEIRKMAEEVIKSQETEIEKLQVWLKQHEQ